MRRLAMRWWVALAASAFVCGCTNTNTTVVKPPLKDTVEPDGKPPPDPATIQMDSALTQLLALDRGSWTKVACARVTKAFVEAGRLAKTRAKRHAAQYNNALVQLRCGKAGAARKILAALLAREPGFHRARHQLAMVDFRSGRKGLDHTITNLNRAVTDAKFANVEALVALAMLQMRRNDSVANDDGDNDMARAKLNLQRALAVDDRYMPAFNQLALYYFQLAVSRTSEILLNAGSGTFRHKTSAGDRATLELAILVCTQAMRKDASYAPIHNTAGLVRVELGDLSGAAKSFDKARKLDPNLFEAHMNAAAVNLQFRGFRTAQLAYDKALKLRPNDYDARLGLALALRGQIGKGRVKELTLASQKQIDKAKQINSKRPEAYFNEAVLTHEFKAHGLADPAPMLKKARKLYGEFMKRAAKSTKPALVIGMKRAKERIADIDTYLKFLAQNKP